MSKLSKGVVSNLAAAKKRYNQIKEALEKRKTVEYHELTEKRDHLIIIIKDVRIVGNEIRLLTEDCREITPLGRDYIAIK